MLVARGARLKHIETSGFASPSKKCIYAPWMMPRYHRRLSQPAGFLLARTRLESADIECFASDENMLGSADGILHIRRDQVAGTPIRGAGRCGHPACAPHAGQSLAASSKMFAGKEAKMRSFILGSSLRCLASLGGLAIAMLAFTHECRLHCATT